ncbi:MAG: YkgJ family cysteine cluster protein [Cyanobacteria bacterium]|nr:YkgJ family cysteine cluster protein [Cyanobacteriota bacterium]
MSHVSIVSDNPAVQAVLEIYRPLDKVSGMLQEKHQAFLQCKAGCDDCCRDGFRIRWAEAVMLMAGLSQLAPEDLVTIQENLKNKLEPGSPGSCPLLINHQCSVYAFRPALCRAYGILVDVNGTVATCHLNYRDLDPQNYPQEILTLAPYYEALEALSQVLWQASPASSDGGADPPFTTIRELLLSMDKAWNSVS